MNGKVVIVCQDGPHCFDRQPYGAMRATVELARHCVRQGSDVILVGMSDARGGSYEGIPFVGVQPERGLRMALRPLGEIDYLVGISRSDVIGVPNARHIVIYHHGFHLPMCGIPIGAINHARVPFICPARALGDFLVGEGLQPELVAVVPNGCDHMPAPGGAAPQRIPFSLLYVGHVVHYKGLDIALRAFDIVRRSYPAAVFHAYGAVADCTPKGDSLWPAGCLDANGAPVWSRIEAEFPGFKYGGEVQPAEVVALYRSHSLLLMSSRVREPFPLVSVEAQAFGCIVVLPRKGGFPETVSEGVSGYLYDDSSPEGLAGAILAIWDNGEPASAQREQAQRWVRATFTWERTGWEITNIMEASPAARSIPAAVYRFWGRWHALGIGITRLFWRLMSVTRRWRHRLGLRRRQTVTEVSEATADEPSCGGQAQTDTDGLR